MRYYLSINVYILQSYYLLNIVRVSRHVVKT